MQLGFQLCYSRDSFTHDIQIHAAKQKDDEKERGGKRCAPEVGVEILFGRMPEEDGGCCHGYPFNLVLQTPVGTRSVSLTSSIGNVNFIG